MACSCSVKNLCDLSISIFYGIIVLIFTFIKILRHRQNFFRVKKRDHLAEKLRDPSLGEHHTINVNDVNLHYVELGNKENQIILMLHGFPCFWYTWKYEMQHLSPDYRCIAVDLRGYNDSDKPSGLENYRADVLIEDLHQLIVKINHTNKPVIVMGHDWGGVLAFGLTSKHGNLVDKMIIINAPHPVAFREVYKKSWQQFFQSWYVSFFRLPILPELVLLGNDIEFLDSAYRKTKLLSDEDVELYKMSFTKPAALTSTLNYYRANFGGAGYQQPEKLDVDRPTLIIWGILDIALTKELATASAKYCHRLSLRFVEDCGHFVNLEKPSLCVGYIREFLSQSL